MAPQPMRTSTRRDLERRLRELADEHRWRRHDHSGRTCAGYLDGFPHEVLVRDDRLLFVFLLSAMGELIPPEQRWLADLAGVRTVESLVFRAGDFQAISHALAANDRPTLVGGRESGWQG